MASMSKGSHETQNGPAGSQTREMPVQLRAAELVPGTFNEADNTVEVVWTTGARVRRYDWWNDTFYEEELVVEADSIDMSRFEAGAVQVLDGHRAWGGVASILGIATRGWIENGEGRATVKLSVREELAGIVADIKAGVIRTISVGYSVQRYEITRAQDRDDGVNMPLYRAVRWQPAEISFVPVPADADAGTRSQQRSRGGEPCEFTFRAPAQVSKEPKMEDDVQTPEATVDQTRAAEEAAAAERQRAAEITEMCARHGVTELITGLIRDNKSVDQARAAVLDELARRDAQAGGQRNVRIETVRDEDDMRLRGMQEALSHRIDASTQLTDAGRQFRGMSLIEMGREHLERRGVNTRGMDRKALAGLILSYRSPGLQSTSDFAHLLANVANNRLRNAYEQSIGTYREWARRAPNAPDFKDIKVTQLSGAPELLQTNEHGEFKYGSMSDGAESYAVVTYGRIVGFTRQAIVNDDMRGFDRLIAAFGGSAARLENRLVYAQLTSNPTMADGVALFHANHGNYGTTGTALTSITPLSAARKAMRVQTGLQGELLNLAPRFLIVPATLEQSAYQFTSPNYVPATKAEINEFRQGGRTALTPVVEPLLDSSSASGWYLAADSAQIDTVEYCYLDGAEGPVIDSEIGFEVDGVSYKCRLDFAAKVIDHRGLYHATGAAA